jgi:hypothetical protein
VLPADLPVDPRLRPHIVSLGNDGRLEPDGPYGTSKADVKRIVNEDIPRLTATWPKKRIMLYAHGGVVGAQAAIAHTQRFHRRFLDAEVYPIFFVWRTDPISVLLFQLEDLLQPVRSRALVLDLEDVQDTLDQVAEVFARNVAFKDQWEEMKENALLATTNASGGARIVAERLAELALADPTVELHLVGHSAGGIFHAPLVQFLTANGKIKFGPMQGQTGLGLPVASCNLWAPGCTVDLFRQTYAQALARKSLHRFALYTLTDNVERADQIGEFYHKSILYLVSNALEDPAGAPLLGMQKFVKGDGELGKLFKSGLAEWILATEKDPPEPKAQSAARTHGHFDDEPVTIQSTIARMRGEI